MQSSSGKGEKKRSWWECALPADEEGNYIVTSTRCARTHTIAWLDSQKLRCWYQTRQLLSSRPHEDEQRTLWKQKRPVSRCASDSVPIVLRRWHIGPPLRTRRAQLWFWWKYQRKFNFEVTRRLLWHWYLFWSPHGRVFRTVCVVREDLFSGFLDHTYSRLDFSPLPFFFASLK